MKMSLAQNRLNKELREYQKKSNTDRISLYLKNKNNIYLQTFYIIIKVPQDYPINREI